jgi:hypothetical protein
VGKIRLARTDSEGENNTTGPTGTVHKATAPSSAMSCEECRGGSGCERETRTEARQFHGVPRHDVQAACPHALDGGVGRHASHSQLSRLCATATGLNTGKVRRVWGVGVAQNRGREGDIDSV